MSGHVFTFWRNELHQRLAALLVTIQDRSLSLKARIAELDIATEKLALDFGKGRRGETNLSDEGANVLRMQAQSIERERIIMRTQIEKLAKARTRAEVFIQDAERASAFKRYKFDEADAAWLLGKELA